MRSMTVVLTAYALAVFLFAAPAMAQQSQPPLPSAEGWRSAAIQDVEAAYQIFRRTHPGMLDPGNPGFSDLLDHARAEGLAEAQHADSYHTYNLALAAFSAPLADGHAMIAGKGAPTGGLQLEAQWPGFLPVWREQGLVVGKTAPDSGVALGSQIVACDGVPAREFLASRLRARFFRPAEEGQFWMKAPLAFNTTSATTNRAQSCLVRDLDGVERDVPIAWTKTPDDFQDMYRAATDGDRLPIGLSEPHPGIFHVALPDFAPDEAGVAAYNALFEEIDGRRNDLSNARALILDMRHNNGGSSRWSRLLAERIWTKPIVEEAMARYFAGVEVWWRAQEETEAQLLTPEEFARRRNETLPLTRAEDFVDKIRAARLAGQNFYVQTWSDRPLADRDLSPVATGFTAPVYVVTSGRCASACLDALDVFTRFQNVTLVGAPTSGDSPYMQVRTEPLPSGWGTAVVPVKIWVRRPRGSEVYYPSIVVNDLEWTTEGFVGRIEQDLVTRRN